MTKKPESLNEQTIKSLQLRLYKHELKRQITEVTPSIADAAGKDYNKLMESLKFRVIISQWLVDQITELEEYFRIRKSSDETSPTPSTEG